MLLIILSSLILSNKCNDLCGYFCACYNASNCAPYNRLNHNCTHKTPQTFYPLLGEYQICPSIPYEWNTYNTKISKRVFITDKCGVFSNDTTVNVTFPIEWWAHGNSTIFGRSVTYIGTCPLLKIDGSVLSSYQTIRDMNIQCTNKKTSAIQLSTSQGDLNIALYNIHTNADTLVQHTNERNFIKLLVEDSSGEKNLFNGTVADGDLTFYCKSNPHYVTIYNKAGEADVVTDTCNVHSTIIDHYFFILNTIIVLEDDAVVSFFDFSKKFFAFSLIIFIFCVLTSNIFSSTNKSKKT